MAGKKKTKKSKRMKSTPAKSKASKKAAIRKKDAVERERGPASWFLPTVEATYTTLRPREVQEQPAASAKGTKAATRKPGFTSALQVKRREEVSF